ncbi:AlpA family phage regulatory protein [Vibrio sp. ED004]|nr:AlpA family phage regulatory protein [Vibrio sp. ED004]
MSKLLTIEDIICTFDISRTTFWRMRQDDTFPKPIMVSKRSPRWSEQEIHKWYYVSR